ASRDYAGRVLRASEGPAITPGTKCFCSIARVSPLGRSDSEIEARADADPGGRNSRVSEIGESPDQVDAKDVEDIVNTESRFEIRLVAQCIGRQHPRVVERKFHLARIGCRIVLGANTADKQLSLHDFPQPQFF